jgi:uncharacterized UPF0160 family protein
MRIVTHSGPFHSDDVFAVAALFLRFGKDIQVIRTRDEGVIATADIVVDVGAEYDENKLRFDHHQGPPLRENNVPYASFGLVWKKFGEELAGSVELARMIDYKLVQPIDAADNSIETVIPAVAGVIPYLIQDAIKSLRPTWKEGDDFDATFMKAVDFAIIILEREIMRAQAKIEAIESVSRAYDASADKRIVVLTQHYPYDLFTANHPDVLFVVFPSNAEGSTWNAKTVGISENSYESRKDFPESWAGKRDGELVAVTGVPDAIFCHRGRFLAVATSREGALRLAELAVEA